MNNIRLLMFVGIVFITTCVCVNGEPNQSQPGSASNPTGLVWYDGHLEPWNIVHEGKLQSSTAASGFDPVANYQRQVQAQNEANQKIRDIQAAGAAQRAANASNGYRPTSAPFQPLTLPSGGFNGGTQNHPLPPTSAPEQRQPGMQGYNDPVPSNRALKPLPSTAPRSAQVGLAPLNFQGGNPYAISPGNTSALGSTQGEIQWTFITPVPGEVRRVNGVPIDADGYIIEMPTPEQIAANPEKYAEEAHMDELDKEYQQQMRNRAYQDRLQAEKYLFKQDGTVDLTSPQTPSLVNALLDPDSPAPDFDWLGTMAKIAKVNDAEANAETYKRTQEICSILAKAQSESGTPKRDESGFLQALSDLSSDGTK